MKAWWDSLKPLERRWAVVIGGIIFLLFNYFFIWPHFGDWKRDEFRLQKAQATNDLYRGEIRHKDDYTRKIRELMSGGDEVLPEDQAIDFIRFVDNCSLNNSIMKTSQSQLVTHTNDYSLDQIMTLGVDASETNLVKFLYSLGAGNSMIRVRDMSLHPAPGQFHLGANLTLVASYQKKAPTRATNGAPDRATAATPAPKPPPPVAASPPVKAAQATNKNAVPPATTPPATNKLAGALARPIASTNKQVH